MAMPSRRSVTPSRDWETAAEQFPIVLRNSSSFRAGGAIRRDGRVLAARGVHADFRFQAKRQADGTGARAPRSRKQQGAAGGAQSGRDAPRADDLQGLRGELPASRVAEASTDAGAVRRGYLGFVPRL